MTTGGGAGWNVFTPYTAVVKAGSPKQSENDGVKHAGQQTGAHHGLPQTGGHHHGLEHGAHQLLQPVQPQQYAGVHPQKGAQPPHDAQA